MNESFNLNDLKCCGNCDHYGFSNKFCNLKKKLQIDIFSYGRCERWKFDGFKFNERTNYSGNRKYLGV